MGAFCIRLQYADTLDSSFENDKEESSMYSISTSDKQLYDDGFLSLEGIFKAYKSQDSRLAEYVIKLCIMG